MNAFIDIEHCYIDAFIFIHLSVVFLSSSKTPLEAININDDDSKIYAFINFKEFLNQIGF